jgi:ribosome-associated translation inhibitor RaiA
MSIPVHITFRDMDASPAMEEILREKITHLASLEQRALGAHVTVEPTDRRHHHGTIHRVTIRFSVPGDELVVSRESGDPSHADPYISARDACDALRRQLVERHRRELHERRH